VGDQPEVIQANPITIFVGPNNSGKSRAPSEIQRFGVTGAKNVNGLMIGKIEFDEFSTEEANIFDRRWMMFGNL